MNTRIIGILLVSIMCITVAVSAAAAQSAPFVINGYVSDSDGNPCNGAWVQVTNTNTSTSWDAENDSTSNYYKFVLDSEDVSVGNVLQIEASGCTKIKMVEHTVTQSEMEDGGINGFTIVFDAQQEIIWQGDVTLINGTTFDVTANSSVSYEINQSTALGALDAASEEGILNYTVNDDWYASWGSLFVDSIADIPSEGNNGWMYWVNYPEDPMPMVGADQFVLEDGDVVTWYWSSSMDTTPANSSKLVNITVAIEEPQETIWQGDVTLINGTTFNKTAHNSGGSYEINRTTALGALDAAAEKDIINYTISDEYYLSWGSLFVDSIADIPSEGYNSWMYWVNYPEDPMPMVGADQFVLEDGDVVTWYWSSSMDTTPANSSKLVNITVAIEEPQDIIWQGDVTLINGTTFDVTANSSVSYEINQSTALGALDAASEEGIFNYTVNDDWYASWGSLFVDSIADIPSEGNNGWMYWVNYPEDPMPMVGADQFVLEDGDVVTWYWSSSMDTTPANSSMLVNINIVIEEPQEIIWQGDVTLINGTTFDVTANSSVSYEINQSTALGALDAASEEGIFNYTVNDDWYASWGSLFVDSIADIPSEGNNGWMYWVNYPEDPMPMVGADQFVLEDGDVVTWYWSSSMDMTPANSSMLVEINVAIEEPQDIIWQGDVTLINGTTFDVTANSSVSYEINQSMALGALDAASEEGIFNYTVNDDWYASWGSLFVDSIADIPSEGNNGWMYWVNYPEDPMPMVGADQFVLEDGDVVTWYWSSSMDTTPANSSMLVEINVTVISPNLIAVTILSPPAITNDSTPLLYATFDHIAALTWYVIDDGAAGTGVSNTDNLTVTLPELADGQHTVTVYANNSYGKVSSATQDFYVDTITPAVTINQMTSPTNNNSQTVNGTFTESGSGIDLITVNGVEATILDSTYSGIISLTEGLNPVDVVVMDKAGNSGSNATSIVLDTIAPELILELINEGNVSTLYINSSEPLSNCTVNNEKCTDSSSKNWSGTLKDTGTHNIIAIDLAGNEALRNLTLEIGKIKETSNNQTNYTTGNVTFNITTTLDVAESNITICEYDENPVGSLETTTVSLLGINKFVQIEVDPHLNKSIGTVRISINYSGADLSEIDEDSLKLYVWNASIESWEELEPSGIDKVKTIVWGELNHLSLFSILGEEPEDVQDDDDNGGSSSSSSSSGGGDSGELYENVVCSEIDRQYVYSNSDITYSYELECNIVQFVKFTSLKSDGQVATKVEILKDTSTLVDNPPSDIVYKNLNIWVGDAGWATESNIADATVVFTVEKSWITENNIDESSIALYRYSDDTWHKLVTRKIAEDANSLQFEAETQGFSPFAVTGKELEGEPGGEGIIAEPTVTAEKTPVSTPTEEKGMPGFGLFAGLSVLLIAVRLLRENK